MLDQVETDEGNAKIDAVQDHLGHVRVVDSDALKDGGAVIEELDAKSAKCKACRVSTHVVSTGKLLEHLKRNPEHDAICHTWRSEHVDVLPDRSVFDLVLGTKLGLNFLQFGVDGIVVCRSAENRYHRLLCLLNASHAVVITWCIREEQYANT